MSVRATLNVADVDYDHITLSVLQRINEPATFTAKLFGKQALSLGSTVKVTRDEAASFLTDGQSTIHQICLYDDDETYWASSPFGTGTIGLTKSEDTTIKISGSSSLKIESAAGTYQYWRMIHNYATDQDWSEKNLICFYWYGVNSGKQIRLIIYAPDSSNTRYYVFTDNFTGWRRFSVWFKDMTVWGSPNLATVRAIMFRGETVNIAPSTWNLDRVVVIGSFFKGVLDKRTYEVGGKYVYTVLEGRDDFALLTRRYLTPTTWADQKVDTVIGDIVTGTGISKGIVSEFDCYRYIENLNQTDAISLCSGATYTRCGQRINSCMAVIDVAFYIKKTGSPTGTAYIRIRKVSDNSIIAETTLDVSTLTTSFDWHLFTFNQTVSPTADVRIVVEYTGGDLSNTVDVGIYGSNVIDGCSTAYSPPPYDTWTDSAGGLDATIKLNYRKDMMTLTVDYTSKAQLILKLAEWLHGEFEVTTVDALNFKPELGTDRSGSITLDGSNCRVAYHGLDELPKTDKIRLIGDAVAVTKGTGTYESVYVDKEITSTVTLHTIGDAILEARQNPVKTLEVYLTRSDSWGLNLGDKVTVNFPDIDINNEAYRIVEIQRDYTDVGEEEVRLILANLVLYQLEKEMWKIVKLEAWQHT